MNRLIKLLLLLTPFLFVSCLDIVEEIDLNSSNGGVATYTFNLSQSKLKLNTLLKLDSIGGHKVPKLYEVEAELAKAVKEIRLKPGISNANYKINDEEFIYTLEINFNSLNNLNNALLTMSYWGSSEWKPKKDFYNLDNNNITKKVEAIIVPENNISEIDKRKESLELGNYTFILRSARELKLVLPSELKLSGNKKAIMYRSNLYDFAKKPKELTLKTVIL